MRRRVLVGVTDAYTGQKARLLVRNLPGNSRRGSDGARSRRAGVGGAYPPQTLVTPRNAVFCCAERLNFC